MSISYYSTTIDCADHRHLAEFYGKLLGWSIEYCDESVAYISGEGGKLGFQKVPNLHRGTNDHATNKQFQFDFAVSDINAAELFVVELGAKKLPSQTGTEDDSSRAYLDPEGYMFCLAEGV